MSSVPAGPSSAVGSSRSHGAAYTSFSMSPSYDVREPSSAVDEAPLKAATSHGDGVNRQKGGSGPFSNESDLSGSKGNDSASSRSSYRSMSPGPTHRDVHGSSHVSLPSTASFASVVNSGATTQSPMRSTENSLPRDTMKPDVAAGYRDGNEANPSVRLTSAYPDPHISSSFATNVLSADFLKIDVYLLLDDSEYSDVLEVRCCYDPDTRNRKEWPSVEMSCIATDWGYSLLHGTLHVDPTLRVASFTFYWEESGKLYGKRKCWEGESNHNRSLSISDGTTSIAIGMRRDKFLLDQTADRFVIASSLYLRYFVSAICYRQFPQCIVSMDEFVRALTRRWKVSGGYSRDNEFLKAQSTLLNEVAGASDTSALAGVCGFYLYLSITGPLLHKTPGWFPPTSEAETSPVVKWVIASSADTDLSKSTTLQRMFCTFFESSLRGSKASLSFFANVVLAMLRMRVDLSVLERIADFAVNSTLPPPALGSVPNYQQFSSESVVNLLKNIKNSPIQLCDCVISLLAFGATSVDEMMQFLSALASTGLTFPSRHAVKFFQRRVDIIRRLDGMIEGVWAAAVQAAQSDNPLLKEICDRFEIVFQAHCRDFQHRRVPVNAFDACVHIVFQGCRPVLTESLVRAVGGKLATVTDLRPLFMGFLSHELNSAKMLPMLLHLLRVDLEFRFADPKANYWEMLIDVADNYDPFVARDRIREIAMDIVVEQLQPKTYALLRSLGNAKPANSSLQPSSFDNFVSDVACHCITTSISNTTITIREALEAIFSFCASSAADIRGFDPANEPRLRDALLTVCACVMTFATVVHASASVNSAVDLFRISGFYECMLVLYNNPLLLDALRARVNWLMPVLSAFRTIGDSMKHMTVVARDIRCLSAFAKTESSNAIVLFGLAGFAKRDPQHVMLELDATLNRFCDQVSALRSMYEYCRQQDAQDALVYVQDIDRMQKEMDDLPLKMVDSPHFDKCHDGFLSYCDTFRQLYSTRIFQNYLRYVGDRQTAPLQQDAPRSCATVLEDVICPTLKEFESAIQCFFKTETIRSAKLAFLREILKGINSVDALNTAYESLAKLNHECFNKSFVKKPDQVRFVDALKAVLSVDLVDCRCRSLRDIVQEVLHSEDTVFAGSTFQHILRMIGVIESKDTSLETYCTALDETLILLHRVRAWSSGFCLDSLNSLESLPGWLLLEKMALSSDLLQLCFRFQRENSNPRNLIDSVDQHADQFLRAQTIADAVEIHEFFLNFSTDFNTGALRNADSFFRLLFPLLDSAGNILLNIVAKLDQCRLHAHGLLRIYTGVANRAEATRTIVLDCVKHGRLRLVADDTTHVVSYDAEGPQFRLKSEELSDLCSRALLLVNSHQQAAEIEALASPGANAGATFGAMQRFIQVVGAMQEIVRNLNRLSAFGGPLEQALRCIEPMISFGDGQHDSLLQAKDICSQTMEEWSSAVQDALCSDAHHLLSFVHPSLYNVIERFFSDRCEQDDVNLVRSIMAFMCPVPTDVAFHVDGLPRFETVQLDVQDLLTRDRFREHCCKRIASVSEMMQMLYQRVLHGITGRQQRETPISFTGIQVIEARTPETLVSTLIEVQYSHERKEFRPLPTANILFCMPQTRFEELLLFLRRCFSDNLRNPSKPATYLLVLPHVLQLQLLNFALDQIRLQSTAVVTQMVKPFTLGIICGTSAQSVMISLKLEVAFVPPRLTSVAIKRALSGAMATADNVSTLVVKSDLPALGKSEVIAIDATSRELRLVSIALGALVSKEDVMRSLARAVSMAAGPQQVALHVVIHHVENVAQISNTHEKQLQDLPLLSMLGSLEIPTLQWDRLQVSNYVLNPTQVVCAYLHALSADTLNTVDVLFSGPKAAIALSADECRALLRRYLVEGEHHDFTFATVRVFVNTLAVQLRKMSTSVFWKVSTIKASSRGATTARSDLVAFMVKMCRGLAQRNTKTLRAVQRQQHGSMSVADARFNGMKKWEETDQLLILFHNSNTSVVSIVARRQETMPQGLVELLKAQGANANALANATATELRTRLIEICCKNPRLVQPDDGKYALTLDNFVKMMLISARIQANVPVVLMGETGCGKTSLIRYLALVSAVEFIVFLVHAGISAADIEDQVLNAEKISIERGVPVWLFFDEINTSVHLGLLNDVVCHRRIRDRAILPPVSLLCACNPYRRRVGEAVSAGLNIRIKRLERPEFAQRRDKSTELVYRVHPLPETMMEYVWDFGRLDDVEEERYIEAMVLKKIADSEAMKNADFLQDNRNHLVVQLVIRAQRFVKAVEADAAVSLRDVNRFLLLLEFFSEHLVPLLRSGALMTGYDYHHFYRVSNVPNWLRATVLALGHAYHARLPTVEARKLFADTIVAVMNKSEIASLVDGTLFQNIIHIEGLSYLSMMVLDQEVAPNAALIENVFVMLVCILNKIPLFVVGKPGCSKSLSLSLIQQSVRGKDSSHSYFKKFPQLQFVSYQGSESSTSEGIKKVFDKAVDYQRKFGANSVISVVVLDEVGLAEISVHNPLKVLHNLLEPSTGEMPEVAVVGVSNWGLDAAKMNRAVHLSRPDLSVGDLQVTARVLIGASSVHMHQINDIVPNLADAYNHYYKNQLRENFHGLRDFYSLCKAMHRNIVLTGQVSREFVLAVQRNFSGMPSASPSIIDQFRHKFSSSVFAFDFRTHDVMHLIKSNLEDSLSRHLMMITSSDSSLSILKSVIQTSNQRNPLILRGSLWPGDQCDDYRYQVLSRIILCMEQGRVLVLRKHDGIYSSLYDVLNQHYVIVGGRRSCRVAIGAFSNPVCTVADGFKCVVLMDQEDVRNADPPFLNRFEKQNASFADVLQSSNDLKNICDTVRRWVDSVSDADGHDASSTFVGYDPTETVPSLVFLMHSIHSGHALMEACKESMLRLMTLDGVARMRYSKLAQQSQEQVANHLHFVADHCFPTSLQEFLLDDSRPKLAVAHCFLDQFSSMSEVMPQSAHVIMLSGVKAEFELAQNFQDFLRSIHETVYVVRMHATDQAEHFLNVLNLLEDMLSQWETAQHGTHLRKRVVVLCHRAPCHMEESSRELRTVFIAGWEHLHFHRTASTDQPSDLMPWMQRAIRDIILTDDATLEERVYASLPRALNLVVAEDAQVPSQIMSDHCRRARASSQFCKILIRCSRHFVEKAQTAKSATWFSDLARATGQMFMNGSLLETGAETIRKHLLWPMVLAIKALEDMAMMEVVTSDVDDALPASLAGILDRTCAHVLFPLIQKPFLGNGRVDAQMVNRKHVPRLGSYRFPFAHVLFAKFSQARVEFESHAKDNALADSQIADWLFEELGASIVVPEHLIAGSDSALALFEDFVTYLSTLCGVAQSAQQLEAHRVIVRRVLQDVHIDSDCELPTAIRLYVENCGQIDMRLRLMSSFSSPKLRSEISDSMTDFDAEVSFDDQFLAALTAAIRPSDDAQLERDAADFHIEMWLQDLTEVTILLQRSGYRKLLPSVRILRELATLFHRNPSLERNDLVILAFSVLDDDDEAFWETAMSLLQDVTGRQDTALLEDYVMFLNRFIRNGKMLPSLAQFLEEADRECFVPFVIPCLKYIAQKISVTSVLDAVTAGCFADAELTRSGSRLGILSRALNRIPAQKPFYDSPLFIAVVDRLIDVLADDEVGIDFDDDQNLWLRAAARSFAILRDPANCGSKLLLASAVACVYVVLKNVADVHLNELNDNGSAMVRLLNDVHNSWSSGNCRYLRAVQVLLLKQVGVGLGTTSEIEEFASDRLNILHFLDVPWAEETTVLDESSGPVGCPVFNSLPGVTDAFSTFLDYLSTRSIARIPDLLHPDRVRATFLFLAGTWSIGQVWPTVQQEMDMFVTEVRRLLNEDVGLRNALDPSYRKALSYIVDCKYPRVVGFDWLAVVSGQVPENGTSFVFSSQVASLIFRLAADLFEPGLQSLFACLARGQISSAVLADLFLPTAAENDEIVAVLAQLSKETDRVTRYRCNCGGLYFVYDCGNQVETGTCPICGEPIGAVNGYGTVRNGVTRIDAAPLTRDNAAAILGKEAIKPGYVNIDPTKLFKFDAVRGMNAIQFRVIRLLLHMSMCIPTLLLDRPVVTLGVAVPLESLCAHIASDMQVLPELLNLSPANTCVFVHSAIRQLLSTAETIPCTLLKRAAERDRLEMLLSQELTTLMADGSAQGAVGDFEAASRMAITDRAFESRLPLEIAECNHNDIADVDYRADMWPAVWRLRDSPSDEAVQSSFMNVTGCRERYPVLNLLFTKCEKLETISALQPVLEFARAVSSIVHQKTSRRVTKAMTFNQLLADHPQLRGQFYEFANAWKEAAPLVRRFQCIARVPVPPEITIDSTIAFAVFDDRDEGIVLTAVIQALADLQNDVLRQLQEIDPPVGRFLTSLPRLSLEDGGGKFPVVPLAKINTTDHIIHCDGFEHVAVVCREWSHQGLEYGAGRLTTYEWEVAEDVSGASLLSNKAIIDVSDLTKVQYSDEIFGGSQNVVRAVQRKIKQEPLTITEVALVKEEFTKKCMVPATLIETFATVFATILRVNPDPSVMLRDFAKDILVANRDHFFQTSHVALISVSKIVSLFELIEDTIGLSLVDNNPAVRDDLPEDARLSATEFFTSRLTPAQQQMLKSGMCRTAVRYLSTDPCPIPPTMPLSYVFASETFQIFLPGDADAGIFSDLPGNLLLRHLAQSFALLDEVIEQQGAVALHESETSMSAAFSSLSLDPNPESSSSVGSGNNHPTPGSSASASFSHTPGIPRAGPPMGKPKVQTKPKTVRREVLDDFDDMA
eukprot:ANDGO_08381.mRNA.1 Putative uncharacterized transmembrane protein DDB_G0290641